MRPTLSRIMFYVGTQNIVVPGEGIPLTPQNFKRVICLIGIYVHHATDRNSILVTNKSIKYLLLDYNFIYIPQFCSSSPPTQSFTPLQRKVLDMQ